MGFSIGATLSAALALTVAISALSYVVPPGARLGDGVLTRSGEDAFIDDGEGPVILAQKSPPSPQEGNGWTNLSASAGPSARSSHAMAYDSESDSAVLFGGLTAGGYNNETWTYDTNTNTWTNRTTDPSPSVRYLHAMAYDSESDRTILFGGWPFNSETWAYDLNNNTWTDMQPSMGPSQRRGPSMAYDEASDRTILFGGSATDETWTYDYNANTWTELNPARGPSPRSLQSLVYDSESDRMILFGGAPANDETWSFDYSNETWSKLGPDPAPPARSSHAAAYDSESDRVILFGGGFAPPSIRSNLTWAYDFNADVWTIMNPDIHPSWRIRPAMAYDSESDEVIMFGGRTEFGGSNETWSYQYRPPTTTLPSQPKALRVTAGDRQVDLAWQTPTSDGGSPIANYRIYKGTESGEVVLLAQVGNVLSYTDTGLTNGVAYYYQVSARNEIGEGPRSNEAANTPISSVTGWTRMTPSLHPSPRSGHRMVYDSESDQVILAGHGETWAYDFNRNKWASDYRSTEASDRADHAMAYDSESDRVILFGGSTVTREEGQFSLDDTWAFDFNTNTWTQMNPDRKPSVDPRSLHDPNFMAYDEESDRVILFGGPKRETWAYDFDTDTWTRMSPNTPPSARQLFAMAYDEESDRIILFGGFINLGGFLGGDTWSYNFNSDVWTQMNPARAPTPRQAYAMAYDSQSDRVLLFGGSTEVGQNDETWAYDYDSNTWTNMRPASEPSRRRDHAMAYDAESDLVIMFGGGASGLGVNDETWAYQYVPRLPSAPRSLQATSGDGRVDLAWGAPFSDGGSTITDYRIYRGTTSGGVAFLVQVGSVLSYTDTDLTNGVAYYYRVSAVNEVGEGPRSNEVTGAPVVLDTTVPTVSITSPTDGATLDFTIESGLVDPEVSLFGTASDDVALEKVEVSANAVTWRRAMGTDEWSATLALGELGESGEKSLYARATDVSGNSATTSITIFVSIIVVDCFDIICRVGGPVTIGVVILVIGVALAVVLLLRRRSRG